MWQVKVIWIKHKDAGIYTQEKIHVPAKEYAIETMMQHLFNNKETVLKVSWRKVPCAINTEGYATYAAR